MIAAIIYFAVGALGHRQFQKWFGPARVDLPHHTPSREKLSALYNALAPIRPWIADNERGYTKAVSDLGPIQWETALRAVESALNIDGLLELERREY